MAEPEPPVVVETVETVETVAAPTPAPAPTDDAPDYASMTVAKLKDALRARGLKLTGTPFPRRETRRARPP